MQGGMKKSRFLTFSDLVKVTIIHRQITWKWYNIQLYLQWPTNRKSYMIYRTAPFSTVTDSIISQIDSAEWIDSNHFGQPNRFESIFPSLLCVPATWSCPDRFVHLDLCPVYSPPWLQGDHLFGKPGNVWEFDSYQGNVGDFAKNRGKILSGKSCLKLFIVSCIFASIQVFSTSTVMIWVTHTGNMPSAANREGNVREFHIVWRVVTLWLCFRSFVLVTILRCLLPAPRYSCTYYSSSIGSAKTECSVTKTVYALNSAKQPDTWFSVWMRQKTFGGREN